MHHSQQAEAGGDPAVGIVCQPALGDVVDRLNSCKVPEEGCKGRVSFLRLLLAEAPSGVDTRLSGNKLHEQGEE